MIPDNAPFVQPAADPDYPARRNKYVVIGIWIGCAALWIPPSILLNLYTFGGIDVPDKTVFRAWFLGGPLLLYGSVLAAPIIALLGVRNRNMGYPVLLALLAVPIIMQVGAVAGYLILTDIYGAVCC